MILKLLSLFFISWLCYATASAQATIERGRLHTECKHRGIRRVKTLDFSSPHVPKQFEGFRLCFVTDTHYASRFTSKTLNELRALLQEVSPDALLLGGDYQEGCEYVEPLMQCFAQCHPPFGAYAVLGNNDYERCTQTICESMNRNGILLVEDSLVQIHKDGAHIWVAGAKNTYSRHETNPCPTKSLCPEDFAILLSHTPDYAEDQDISGTDLVLAGHTHGGQVTLFGLWAPKTASHYGQRFVKGLNYTSAGVPVMTSTGIGTSRVAIRAFAPSEIVIITLHHTND